MVFVWANSGAMTEYTDLPTIAASIIALVFAPTTAALWASESKKSERASPASGSAPSRGQMLTLSKRVVSKLRHWPACLGCGLTTIPTALRAGSSAARIASIQRVTKPTSSGEMNALEHR